MKRPRFGVRAARAAIAASPFLVLAVLATPVAGLQTASVTDATSDPQKVLVLDFQVVDRSVNPDETGEITRVATEAARMFRERVEEDGRFTLVTMERFQDARSRLQSGGSGCTDAACAREAARSVGVQRVFRGRVIKVSNLIWYLVMEHEDAASGKVLGQESIELKGQRDVILPRAVAALHRWLLPAG